MLHAGAFGTILNERGEVLLCHRRDLDLWNPPGGRVEVGESPWEAVVREIREETRVEAAVVRLASVSWKPGRKEIVFQSSAGSSLVRRAQPTSPTASSTSRLTNCRSNWAPPFVGGYWSGL